MRFSVVGGNVPLLKQQNRAAILRAILAFGPLSRRALCRRTGLTASAISNLVGELIADGVVRELGVLAASERPVRPGRREVMVDLVGNGIYVVGTHIGLLTTLVGVGNLRGEIVARRRFATDAERGPEHLIARIGEQISKTLLGAGLARGQVVGLGAAVLGEVGANSGTLHFAPALGWEQLDVGARLQEATGLPTVVDSSRSAMALAEMMLGEGRSGRDFMLVYVGSTIGAGIVLDQRLHRGASGGSGQIGHTPVPGAHERCHCGRVGCLDAVASERAFDRMAIELFGDTRAADRGEAADDSVSDMPRHRLYARARDGEPTATRLLVEAGERIGLAVASVVSVLDLDLVLVGGAVVRECPPFLDAVRNQVQTHAFRVPDAVTEVKESTFGPDAALVGGLALALHDLVYTPSATVGCRAKSVS